jgi:hypothetical protein
MNEFNFIFKIGIKLLIEYLIELIVKIPKISKVTLRVVTVFEKEASSVLVFDFEGNMIVIYENEVLEVIYTSNID